MERAAVLGRLGGVPLTWQIGEVAEIRPENPRVRSMVLEISGWRGHRAGQHVDARLTAEDGYQAVRSYSIASPPEEPRVEITVEQLVDGEVSPFLVEEVRVGDKLEFRGPIGGYFTWQAAQGGPLVLIAGGSGVVPLMAMIRHRERSGSDVPVRLLYSSRSAEEVIYGGELDALAGKGDGVEVVHTFTRTPPEEWTGYRRRVDAAMLGEVAWTPGERPLIYVCGPTQFVETVATALVGLGHVPERIKTERFGPTGR